MPVIAAIIGAILSGLFMWVVWGNGMEVINHLIDKKSAEKRDNRNAVAIEAARVREARAPLRAIDDPREGVLVLLMKLAMARGDVTPEQHAAITTIAEERLKLEGKIANDLRYAEFTAGAVSLAVDIVMDLAPLFVGRLTDEEFKDLFSMLDEIGALHGGPTAKQEEMIAMIKRRFSGAAPN